MNQKFAAKLYFDNELLGKLTSEDPLGEEGWDDEDMDDDIIEDDDEEGINDDPEDEDEEEEEGDGW